MASTPAAYSRPATYAPASNCGPCFVELGERAGQVHVREDEVRLRRLVGATEEHGIGAVAHELDALEVTDDRVHRQGEDALARQCLHRRRSDRLDLVRLDLDPEPCELRHDLRARPGRRVRHESKTVTVVAKLPHGFGGTGDRVA
jgi:hypothetical protein